ncbi:MAG: hypothetical protein WCD12_01340 [Candidatus Binatus sp.]|jgi:hypothetical protein|uniref:hypothetical protein n=1 Tax=Candidatus Binatus sp. TaxID=2811406 RepID=UPI003C718B81
MKKTAGPIQSGRRFHFSPAGTARFPACERIAKNPGSMTLFCCRERAKLGSLTPDFEQDREDRVASVGIFYSFAVFALRENAVSARAGGSMKFRVVADGKV